MRINTQRRPGTVHSQKAIRALSLLNKPVTSLRMKLSLGELLTNTSSKVWHALHLTPPPVNVSIPPNQDNSPESPHALWWHLILKSLWEKPALSLCEERKKLNLSQLTRFTSQSYSKLPNYWQIHRHTWKRLSDCGILLQKTNPIQRQLNLSFEEWKIPKYF